MGRKKNAFSIFMVVLFSFCLLAVEGQAALVAHWAFDEGSGTTVHDSLGTYPGTLAGSATWSPTGGKSGGAIILARGTGDYVTMGNVLPLTGTDFSLVAWVKTTAVDNNIISKHQSGEVSGYVLSNNENGGYGSPGKAWFYGRGEPSLAPISQTTVNDGNWHQVVVTYVQGGNASIYVDGVPVEDFHPTAPIVANDAPFLIGGLTSWAAYDGLIDDVQIYSHALSDSEVQWLFDHPGQAVCAPAPSGMVSWWKAEGNANDARGRNNGTLFGGAGFVSGRVDQAFSFDGSTQYLQIANPKDIPLGNASRTVLAWIKWNDAPPGALHQNIFAYGSWGTYAGTFFFERKSDTGKLYLTGYFTELVGNTVIAPDIRYLVAVTHDGTTSKFYVNGSEDGSATITHNTIMNAEGIKIGDAPGNDGNHGKFNGLIDEVTVFNRALSQQEIAAVYGAAGGGVCPCAPSPAGLVSQWKAEGNANDFVGNNNGNLVNGAGYAMGKVGQAFSFDGTDDYVALPDAASHLLNDSAGTISAWVYPSALGDNDIVVAFGSGENGQGIGLGIWGNIRIYHHTGTYDWQSNTGVEANTWTLLTYSWDAAEEKIYKNGVFSESRPRNFSYVPGQGRIGHGFLGGSGQRFSRTYR